jgi:dTDP-4-dehydrorhamnose 3,5-epimerase
MLIPRGFAHGFSVLSPVAVFSYKCDGYYAPSAERGIAFDDPLLNIDWKIEKESLKFSEKDRKNPKFVDSEYNFILKQ